MLTSRGQQPILPTMRRLLCISGKRFSGKDTFAALLREKALAGGIEVATFAFAGESKQMFVAAESARGVVVDLERLTLDRAYKESWRPQLTQFTVDALAGDPLVFVREVGRRIEASGRLAIVTDLRLRLEVEWLRPRFELFVVRLERGDAGRAAAGWSFDAAKDLHHTETELDEPSLWDRIVVNDGSLAELADEASAVLSVALP